jgi:hypothetical protein
MSEGPPIFGEPSPCYTKSVSNHIRNRHSKRLLLRLYNGLVTARKGSVIKLRVRCRRRHND